MAGEEEDIIEISDEEKLQIAQHYLLSSPPGQFQEVLADVKKLLPDGILTDSLLAGMARAYNIKGRITDSNGEKIVICSQSELDPTHYFNSKTARSVLFNHLTLSTSDEEIDFVVDQTLESKRSKIQSILNSYVANKYPSPDSAVGVYAKDGSIYIVVVGEKKNLRNFWSGKWTSVWNVILSSGSATISGDVKVHGHYFEDGNVQLHSSKSYPGKTFSFNSEEDLAKSIEEYIKVSENSLQSGLEEVYVNMSDETFKSMRRSMPITRTKMDWNINAVRMVRQVQKK